MPKKHSKAGDASPRSGKLSFARLLTASQRDLIINALTSYGPISTTLVLQEFLQSIGEPASDTVLLELFVKLAEVVPPPPTQPSGGKGPSSGIDSNEASILSSNNDEPQTLHFVTAPYFQPHIDCDVVLELLGMLKQKAARNAATQDDTKEVFEALCVEDVNGQASVNAEQVRLIATTFRLNVDVDAILRKYDSDGSGLLELHEFRKIFQQDDDALRSAARVVARKFNHPVRYEGQVNDEILDQEEEDLAMFLDKGCQEYHVARKFIDRQRAEHIQREQKKKSTLLNSSVNTFTHLLQPDADAAEDNSRRYTTAESTNIVTAAALIRDPEIWIGSGLAAATASSLEEQLQLAKSSLDKDPLVHVRGYNSGNKNYYNAGASVDPQVLGSPLALPAIASARKHKDGEQSSARGDRSGAMHTPRGASNTKKLTLPPINSPRTIQQR